MKQRILTGTVLAVIFIALLVWGGLAFSFLCMALAVIGIYEFLRLHGYRFFDSAGLLAMLSVVYLSSPWSQHFPRGDVLWMILLALLIVTVISKNKIHIQHVAVVFIGSVYIGFGFHAMSMVRLEYGMMWTLLIFGCTVLSDTGAYFMGRAIGRTPLWPTISPNKTIEGAVGGVFFALLFAVLFSNALPAQISMLEAALIGVIIAVAGQMGDLIQSAYKRINNVKDSGSIFPGHGGVLDRCDSWLIVFPLMYLLLTVYY